MIYLGLLLLLIFGFFIPIGFAFYGIFCIYVDFTGAPYVPTSGKIVAEILAEANLEKGQKWVELGSGDGRVTMMAVQKYGVKGLGIDLHIPLILYSRFIAEIKRIKNITFKIKNFNDIDLKDFDVIFMFLLPVTIEKMKPKFLRECKKGALLISHGFQVKEFEKYLIHKQVRKLFPTYFYKLK